MNPKQGKRNVDYKFKKENLKKNYIYYNDI